DLAGPATPGTAPGRVVGAPEYVQYTVRPSALPGFPSALAGPGRPHGTGRRELGRQDPKETA
ncbi:hypothetical protein ACFCXH_42205, partial [Streptomyces nojiriensis]|uniref:hypothetical protein n=1 Tax=Streptomyces nojiriensis TaxID=66374 RepID=UPI0035DF061E